MKVKHELFRNVGIFTISGDINEEHEDNLKIVLMKAVHGENRSVLNFRGVHNISRTGRKLLKKAYCASLRLNNPIIITELPETYMPEIFSCESLNTNVVPAHIKTGKDSGKEGELSGIN